jgi:hypothetical protein
VSETDHLLRLSNSLLRALIYNPRERISHLKYRVQPVYVIKLLKKGGGTEKTDVTEKFSGVCKKKELTEDEQI